MPRQIAIRLGTEGKAQVVADLDAIGTAGDAAFARASRQAIRFADDAEAAIDRANRSAAKLDVLRPGLNPTKLDAYSSTSQSRSGRPARMGFGAQPLCIVI